MRKATTLAAALIAAALIAGCGGDGDSSETTTTAPSATNPPERATEPDASGGGEEGKADPKAPQEPAQAKGQAAGVKPTGGAKTPAGAEHAEPAQFKAPKGGDDSIQTYGEEAGDDEAEAVIAAMRSFFAAMAAVDPAGICEGLISSTRESLALYLKAKGQEGSCESALAALPLQRGAAEARQAANASVLEVRIEGDTAFVLFTPEGGAPSYFVMKSEDGAWRSTGLSPGTPFNPTAG